MNLLGAEAFLQIGPLAITATVMTSWGVMLLWGLLSKGLTRTLEVEQGGGRPE